MNRRMHTSSQEKPVFLLNTEKNETCFLPVVYEDEEIFALNKTEKLHSAPLPMEEKKTAVTAAIAYQKQPVEHLPPEAGLLHRLDYHTSGLLLFAKNNDSYKRMKENWREVRKIYRAICLYPSRPDLEKELPLSIQWSIGHSKKSKKRMITIKNDLHRRQIRGKPLSAETKVTQIVKTIKLENGTPALDLEIEIRSGVMHQIRCHLLAEGLPILGDPIYGKTGNSRLWLHAWRASFLKASLRQNSEEGKTEVQIQAPLPENWPGS